MAVGAIHQEQHVSRARVAAYVGIPAAIILALIWIWPEARERASAARRAVPGAYPIPPLPEPQEREVLTTQEVTGA
jgi:hypothetical protein